MWRERQRGKTRQLMRSLFSTNCLLLLIWQKYVISSQVSDIVVAIFWNRKKSCLLPHTGFLDFGSLGMILSLEVLQVTENWQVPPHWFLTGSLWDGGGVEFCLGLGWALCLAPQPVTPSSRNLTDRGCLSGERCEWARLSLPSRASTFCLLLGKPSFWPGSQWLCGKTAHQRWHWSCDWDEPWIPLVSNPYRLTVPYSSSGSERERESVCVWQLNGKQLKKKKDRRLRQSSRKQAVLV